MAHVPSILIYGNDATLLDTRQWVLESAHFRVTTTSALPSALAALTEKAPDLLVLCHTLSADERNSINAALAALKLPAKTLTFSPTHRTIDRAEILGEVVDGFEGPHGLIAAAKRLLS